MSEAVCEACGARNPADAQFCRICGAYLGFEGATRLLSDEDGDRTEARARALDKTRAPTTLPNTPTALDHPRSQARCPRCDTPAEPGRWFCRRCGQGVRRPAADALPAAAPRDRWWRRRLSHEHLEARAARAAYRRSLPVRYRLTRLVLIVAVVAAGVGAVAISRRDPVGWARTTIADLRGSTQDVAVRPSVRLPDQALPDHPAELAVDGYADSYWATAWQTTPSDASGGDLNSCSEPGDVPPSNALILDLPRAMPLRELWIVPAPPENDPQRARWWIPTAANVSFDDGTTCLRMPLAPSTEPQPLKLRLTARRVAVAVVAAAPPQADDAQPGAAQGRVGIAEVVLRSRGS